jgi:hypothetical protein
MLGARWGQAYRAAFKDKTLTVGRDFDGIQRNLKCESFWRGDRFDVAKGNLFSTSI